MISMNYGSSISSWKPWRWVRLDLILMMKDIQVNSNLNPVIKFTNSSNMFLPRNISQMITKTIQSVWEWSTLCSKMGYPVLNLIKHQWKQTTTWLAFPIWGNHYRTNTSMRVRIWDPSRKINHLCKVVWDRKIITEFTRSINSTRIG